MTTITLLNGGVLMTDPANGDIIPIVDVSEPLSEDKTKPITRQVLAGWYWLDSPLTSTDWDGDTKTDANREIIDLSDKFGVPPGVKAVAIAVQGAGAAVNNYIRFGPSVSYNHVLTVRTQVAGVTNHGGQIVPCDANGDIYVYVSTGASITGVYLWIYGYFL